MADRSDLSRDLTRDPPGNARPKPLLALVAPLVFVLGVAPFLGVLGNGFVNWDDDAMLLNSSSWRGLSPVHLKWFFTTFHLGHYQPLTWLSFAIDNRIWGMDPFGYHLTSLLLHGLNALLVFLLIAALIRTEDAPTPRIVTASAAGALFFAIHPLRVESVAWAVQRRDLLAAALLLGTVLAYLRASRETAPRARRRWLAASLALYLLSLLSKATGVTLAVILVILDFYPLRRVGPAGGRDTLWRVVLEKLPYLGLGAVFSLVAVLAQKHAGALGTLLQHPPVSRLVQGVYGLGFYVAKTILPTGLSPLYQVPPTINPWEFRFSAALLVVPAAIAAVLVGGRRRPWWPAAAGCYTAVLLPVLGVFQSGPQLVADRYSYVACLPWAALVAGVLARTAVNLRKGLLAALAALLLLLGTMSWRQTAAWKSGTTLWDHVLAVQPEASFAWHNQGELLLQEERYAEAIVRFDRAIALFPGYAPSHNDLGVALSRIGRPADSAAAFEAAARLDQRQIGYLMNLAKERTKLRQRPQAVEAYRSVVALEPANVEARFQLGISLLASGDLAGAIVQQQVLSALDERRGAMLKGFIGSRSSRGSP